MADPESDLATTVAFGAESSDRPTASTETSRDADAARSTSQDVSRVPPGDADYQQGTANRAPRLERTTDSG